MDKKRIAVIFGGCSSEYLISLSSGYAVLANMDKEKYEIIPIGITEDGRWFSLQGRYRKRKKRQVAAGQTKLHTCLHSS